MQTIGIVGASGYSGEVLVEILSAHPRVDRLVVASKSHAGKRVDVVLPRLAGLVGDLTFVPAEPAALAAKDVPVWFLALPHGVAAEYALAFIEAGRRVIDLSADFRLHSAELYREYYGGEHPAPEWLAKAPYVLPEFNTAGWEAAPLIACPGCYPTSVLMPLLPLLRDGVIQGDGIVVNSLSGISGAGKKESLYYSYCERGESATAYGLGKHRHLAEIEEQLSFAAGRSIQIQFTPHLVPMMRGIVTSTVVREAIPVAEIYRCWQKAYSGRPGVRILPPGTAPDSRMLVGRTRIDFSAYADERTGNTVITSAEDNLLKGAGGQGVQILNLLMGWPEFAGLK